MGFDEANSRGKKGERRKRILRESHLHWRVGRGPKAKSPKEKKPFVGSFQRRPEGGGESGWGRRVFEKFADRPGQVRKVPGLEAGRKKNGVFCAGTEKPIKAKSPKVRERKKSVHIGGRGNIWRSRHHYITRTEAEKDPWPWTVTWSKGLQRSLPEKGLIVEKPEKTKKTTENGDY